MEHISLTSSDPFVPVSLPRPAALFTYGDALAAVHYYIGKYAVRLNDIAASRGYESRQRVLYMIVRLIFFWKEKALPVNALEEEVPALFDWAENEPAPAMM